MKDTDTYESTEEGSVDGAKIRHCVQSKDVWLNKRFERRDQAFGWLAERGCLLQWVESVGVGRCGTKSGVETRNV